MRKRKKALTRQLIADTAALLFAEGGSENVAVRDVAREADVAEQMLRGSGAASVDRALSD